MPWIAVDPRSGEVYTDEWDMPHDRINVFDATMHLKRFVTLKYPASFGKGFHLNRVKSARVTCCTP